MNDSAIVARILQLKAEQEAVVLAHNYQLPEIYQVADFIGDSLELAQQAQKSRARTIVFCGVQFMAETAKLLNPGARVVLAEPTAGCQMADMISASALRQRRRELEPVTVVAYVNTTAEVKAEADICCTSANAVRVVSSLPARDRILFVPDENLASYVARTTGRAIIPWPGFCYVHAGFRVEDVARARREYPNARIIVHPECRPEVIAVADDVASTSGMVWLAASYGEVVLGTEAGMCARIARDHPQVRCYPLRRAALCRNMKLTSLASVEAALAGSVPEIVLPSQIVDRARAAIERMLALG